MNKNHIIVLVNVILMFSVSQSWTQSATDRNYFDNNAFKDSIKVENKYQLSLIPKANFHSPLLLLGTHRFQNPYLEFYLPQFGSSQLLTNSDSISVAQLRAEMINSLAVFRQGQLKTDLGFVGQVLGYSQTAAVFGMAIYHIYKYGFK